VRDRERLESDDEGACAQPNEDVSEEQAPSTEPDEAEIAEFLTIISNYAKQATDGMPDPGVLQLSRLYPDAKTMVPHRFEIRDVEHTTEAACVDARRGHNVYVEPRTVRRDLKGSDRGKLEDTVASFALVADSDNDKDEPGYVPIQPTLITESSYGTGNANLWFVFDRALSAEQAKELGTLMREATGADSNTGNPAQPYRVAGTPNFPNAKKRERGRIAGPTCILEHSGKVWTHDELREALEAIEPRKETRKEKKTGRPWRGAGAKGNHARDERGLPSSLVNLIVVCCVDGQIAAAM
jgi:hypothetical protein